MIQLDVILLLLYYMCFSEAGAGLARARCSYCCVVRERSGYAHQNDPPEDLLVNTYTGTHSCTGLYPLQRPRMDSEGRHQGLSKVLSKQRHGEREREPLPERKRWITENLMEETRFERIAETNC